MSSLENHSPFSFPFSQKNPQPNSRTNMPGHSPTQSEEDFLPPLSLPPTKNVYETLWDEKVKNQPFYSTNQPTSIKATLLSPSLKPLKQYSQKYNSSPVHTAATPVLFRDQKKESISRLHAMPENTISEKIEKERVFRNLLLENYQIKPIIHDHNNGLRAIVSSLHPAIPPESEETTAYLLRGDLIQHVLRHPEHWGYLMQLEEENTGKALLEWYEKMQRKEAIGFLEIGTISHMLKIPIEIFSFEKLETASGNALLPSDEMCFGKEYDKPAMTLYFDPVHSHFMPLFPRI